MSLDPLTLVTVLFTQPTLCPKVPVTSKAYLFSAILNFITEPSCLLIPHTARFDLVFYNTWWLLCNRVVSALTRSLGVS